MRVSDPVRFERRTVVDIYNFRSDHFGRFAERDASDYALHRIFGCRRVSAHFVCLISNHECMDGRVAADSLAVRRADHDNVLSNVWTDRVPLYVFETYSPAPAIACTSSGIIILPTISPPGA